MVLCKKCEKPLIEDTEELDHCKTCEHKEGCWLIEEYCKNCLEEMHTSEDGIIEQFGNLSIDEKKALNLIMREEVLTLRLKEIVSRLYKKFEGLN